MSQQEEQLMKKNKSQRRTAHKDRTNQEEGLAPAAF
jgi:hypothetical protein